MTFLVFAGIVAFLSGIMFILFPKVLIGITDWANRLAINIDKKAIKYRLGLGICLILSGAFLWFIAYCMKVIPVLRSMN